MKYIILMGRGIEGTGNTKYAIEMRSFLVSRGDECRIIANNDKKWGREKAHEDASTIEQMSFSTCYKRVIEACCAADLVIVLSVPAKNYSYASTESFHTIVKTLHDRGVKQVYFQLDHRVHSINRNYYADFLYDDFFMQMNKVITHHTDGDFIKFCEKNDIALPEVVAAENLGISSINPIRFDDYLSYWINADRKLDKSLRFIGRCAPWKGLWQVRDLHQMFLKSQGYITCIEGVEHSIQSVAELYKCTKPERIPRDDVVIHTNKEDVLALDNGTFKYERNMPAYILPPYNNDKALRRMASSMFGIELLMLDANFLKSNLEYAMMEIVAVGTIPVFREKWGRQFLVNGVPIIEACPYIIYMDETRPYKAIDTMNALNDDHAEYDYRREKIFEFFKNNFDRDVMFTKIIEEVNNADN